MSPRSCFLLSIALAQPMLSASEVPQFDIDLDAPAEKRWDKVVSHYRPKMIAMAQAAKPQFLTRAPWAWLKVVQYDPEHEAEMEGIAKAVNHPDVDVDFVKTMNLLYEIESPTACSAVLWAMKNGTVMQGRNMDYGLHFDMPDGKTLNWPDVTFQAIFHKAGKPLFETTHWPFLVGVHTGLRYGGWGFQQNTRQGKNEWHSNFRAAQKGGKAFLLESRKALETIPDFKSAVNLFSTTQWIAPQYFVITGTGPYEGVVITVDRLGEHLPETPDMKKLSNDDRGWHLVQTNDDLGQEPLDVRRPIANFMLGGATQDIISQDHLMQFMHSSPLFWNGTVFSTVMVPALDYYKTNLPNEGHSIKRELFTNAPAAGEEHVPAKLEAMISKTVGKPGSEALASLVQKHAFLSRQG